METTDRLGNEIFKGGYNVDYNVFDMADYPQVYHTVSKSDTTESVYVTYTNSDNLERIVVRFSNHVNNAVQFGDQLDGNFASANEILFHLGLKKRVFVPKTRLSIIASQVKKSLIQDYEMADLTIAEMYNLGKDADISMYKGKVAKNSNWLILGDKVEEIIETTQNILGQSVQKGQYIYE